MSCRQHHVSHGHSGHHQVSSGGGNPYSGGGRNSIFNDDGPGFGNTFGGVNDQPSMRMPSSQVNPSLGRDVGFSYWNFYLKARLPSYAAVC